MLLVAVAVILATVAVTAGSAAQARQPGAGGSGTKSCGYVAPPLPAGLHEGYSFFKVTVRNLGCREARRVARRYVELTNHSTPPLPRDRSGVLGFDCIVSSTGRLVRCRRGRSLVVGHNGGF